MRHPVQCVIAALLAALNAVGLAQAAVPDTDPLPTYVTSISEQLDPRVAQVLVQLDGIGRQLLALRSYLRSAPHLADRWSWTQEQIDAYEGSPEQRDLHREIDRVRSAFVAASPGFELYVNSKVRSLEVQIDHWNSNESVRAAAEETLAAAQALIGSTGFPADRPQQAREALKAFLSGHRPVPTPTIAAPGLSLHGQMRAVDFQVHRGGRVVAGPSTATIATDWAAAGWAAKLDAAVREASSRFVGPQVSPPAPWHYTYVPEAVTLDQAPADAPAASGPSVVGGTRCASSRNTCPDQSHEAAGGRVRSH